ncbi:MAG: ABC transporter ATP-binding protein [Dermatophilaceae bacterium]
MPKTADAIREVTSLRSVMRRLWPHSRGARLGLAIGSVLVIQEIAGEAAATWMFKVLTDDVLQPANFEPFPRIAAIYLTLTVITTTTSYGANLTLAGAGEKFIRQLRTATFGNLLSLSPRFSAEHPSGDLMSRLDGDIEGVEVLAISGVATAIEAVTRILAFGTLLFLLDVKMALMTAVGAPILWAAGRLISGRLDRAATRSRRARGRLLDISERALNDVPLIQTHVRQGYETARFDRAARAAEVAGVDTVRIAGLSTPIVQILEMVSIMAVIGVGAWQLVHHDLTLGSLLVFLAYLTQLYEPLGTMAGLAASVGTATASARRVVEVLSAAPDIADGPDVEPLPFATGALRLTDVTFTHPGGTEPALRGVTMTIPPGRRVAVVGPSGSGKSTLARLLVRLYDPDEGAIELDNHQLPTVRVDDVRSHITLVPQHPSLTEGTVRESILWANPDAGESAFRDAVERADVSTVVTSLPHGLDTDTGHRGSSLSGGERQRVALARGLLRDTPVLVLDEPTAALDPGSEETVMERLRLDDRGRTTIVITHRLSTIRDVDDIYVLDHGRIVERGTHSQLVAARGLYRTLWDTETRSQDEGGSDEDVDFGDFADVGISVAST